MSERKVLTKYYPPDFDPSKLERRRKPPPGTANLSKQLQTVRLMAPFSMKCLRCGEYIYKGRKFNARKETTDEKYYALAIFRFYIRCTRCSAEITFKTDPKNMDYECERGASRNFEPWRQGGAGTEHDNETEEERLDRLEKEEGERDRMGELEKKTEDARVEIKIADALDEVRLRNAQRERVGGGEVEVMEKADMVDGEAEMEREIERQARAAFLAATGERVRRVQEDDEAEHVEPNPGGGDMAVRQLPADTLQHDLDKMAMPPPPLPAPASFQRKPKQKIDRAALLGIRKKSTLV